MLRLIRTGVIHYQFLSDASMGFQAIHATIKHFTDAENGDVLRLDFEHSR